MNECYGLAKLLWLIWPKKNGKKKEFWIAGRNDPSQKSEPPQTKAKTGDLKGIFANVAQTNVDPAFAIALTVLTAR